MLYNQLYLLWMADRVGHSGIHNDGSCTINILIVDTAIKPCLVIGI